MFEKVLFTLFYCSSSLFLLFWLLEYNLRLTYTIFISEVKLFVCIFYSFIIMIIVDKLVSIRNINFFEFFGPINFHCIHFIRDEFCGSDQSFLPKFCSKLIVQFLEHYNSCY